MTRAGLSVQCLPLMPLDEDHNFAYDNRPVVDWLSAVGAWVKRWVRRSIRDNAFPCDKISCANMIFIRCNEEELHVSANIDFGKELSSGWYSSHYSQF